MSKTPRCLWKASSPGQPHEADAPRAPIDLAISDDQGVTVVINDRQRAVLDWIADGCPDGVYKGEGHKVSAAALRARGLVKIRGRGQAWNAELTDRGREFLAGSSAPRPASPPSRPVRTPATDRKPQSSLATPAVDKPPTKTEQLVANVIAADGRLVLPDETARGGINWRQRAYAAQRHGKVPDGKRLVVSRVATDSSSSSWTARPATSSAQRRSMSRPD